MRILIIEDDKKIASFVMKGLNEAGFVVDHVDNGADGLNRALQQSYDAAVVDIMLPRLDGLSMIERMRARKILTPVLILSAKRAVDDRIKGLRTGGDDYLTKPFSFAELLARVEALIRRAGREPEPTLLQAGDFTVDLLKREVTRAGKRLDLQPREFALLHYLMRNLGKVVSKTMIIEHVWGYHFDPLTNIVDVLISRLRHKLDRDFDKKLIHTHRGVGYALKVS
jgi:two-component system, OmpR family, response regulator